MDAEEFEEESHGGSPILAILLLLVVILLGVVGYLGYIMYQKGFFGDDKDENSSTSQTQNTNQAPKIVNGKVKKIDPYEKPDVMMFSGSIDNLVLNIVNNRGREKLMKLSYDLEGPYEGMAALVEKHRVAIIDATIRLAATTTSNELLTITGKMHFNSLLKEEINKIINEKEKMNPNIPEYVVKKLYFKAFVMR